MIATGCGSLGAVSHNVLPERCHPPCSPGAEARSKAVVSGTHAMKEAQPGGRPEVLGVIAASLEEGSASPIVDGAQQVGDRRR